MYVPSISRRFDGIAPHEGTESPPSVEATRFKRTVSMGLPRMRGLKDQQQDSTSHHRQQRFDGIAPHEGTESQWRPDQAPFQHQSFDGIAPHEGTERTTAVNGDVDAKRVSMGLPRMRGLKAPDQFGNTFNASTVSMGLPRMRGLKGVSRKSGRWALRRFDGIAPHEGTESLLLQKMFVPLPVVSMGLPRMRGLKECLCTLCDSHA